MDKLTFNREYLEQLGTHMQSVGKVDGYDDMLAAGRILVALSEGEKGRTLERLNIEAECLGEVIVLEDFHQPNPPKE